MDLARRLRLSMYYPLAVSASATRRPISPFAAQELSTVDVRATVRDFLRYAVLARDVGYDRVKIMGSKVYPINHFYSLPGRTNGTLSTVATPNAAGRGDCARHAGGVRPGLHIPHSSISACWT